VGFSVMGGWASVIWVGYSDMGGLQ